MTTRLEYPNPTDPAPLYTKLLLEGIDDWNRFLIRASEVLTPGEAELEGLSLERTICMAIYRAYQCERDTEPSAPKIGAKVIQLIHQFPFLIPRRYIPLDSLSFDCMVSNHQFDGSPSLYGLSQGEAHELRGTINGRRSARDEGYLAFCRNNNIAINPYHVR